MDILDIKGGIFLKNKGDETSEGLNQIFEIINAKGDEGELREIVEKTDSASTDKKELVD
jgi:hypothetical protein